MNLIRARGVRTVVPLLLLACVFAACTRGTPQANSNGVATPSGAASVQTPPQATKLPATAPMAVPSAVAIVPPTTLSDTATPAPTATNAPAVAATIAVTTASPSGANGGLSDLIIAAQRALMSTSAYRVRTITTLANGTTTTTTVEFVAPDRFSMAQPGGEGFIIIGTNSYQKGPNTGWQKSAIDMSGIINSFRDPKVLEDLAKSIITSDVQRLGDDTLNGRSMHVYQYNTAVTVGDKTIRGATKIWIGADDGLPYRQEGDQDSILGTGRTHSIITYDYNSADIKIDSPVVP